VRVAIVIVDRRRDATPSIWMVLCCFGSSGQHKIKWAAAVVELRSSDSDPIDSDNQHGSTSLSSSSSAIFFLFFFCNEEEEDDDNPIGILLLLRLSAVAGAAMWRCLVPETWAVAAAVAVSCRAWNIIFIADDVLLLLSEWNWAKERERGTDRQTDRPTDRMRACVQLSSLPRDIRRRATTLCVCVCVCALSSLYCSVLFLSHLVPYSPSSLLFQVLEQMTPSSLLSFSLFLPSSSSVKHRKNKRLNLLSLLLLLLLRHHLHHFLLFPHRPPPTPTTKNRVETRVKANRRGKKERIRQIE